MVDDMIDVTTTSTSKGDSKEEVKTMETDKINHIDPFNAMHSLMKDKDMHNVLTKFKPT